MRTPALLVALATLVAALLCLAGCASTGSGVGRESAKSPLLDIRKGSPTTDLIAALGEPDSIEPYKNDPEHVQVWTYERKSSHTDMVAYRTREVPYVDPFTGEMKTILEPDYQPERITTTETIKVFVVDETVAGWNVDRDVNRDIVE